MQVAMVAAGFSATEADQLRRAMATFKFTGGVNKFQDKLIKGMIDNGYDTRICRAHVQAARRLRLLRLSGKPCRQLRADRLRLQLDEMPSSGCVLLPRSSTRSRWASMIRRSWCATRKQHGVEVRPIDVNRSQWDCTLEPLDTERRAVRLGLRMTRGLAEKDGSASQRRATHALHQYSRTRPARQHASGLAGAPCQVRRLPLHGHQPP